MVFYLEVTDETDNTTYNTDVHKWMQIFNYLTNTARETIEKIFLHNIHTCIIDNSLDEKTSLSTACGIYVQRVHRYPVCIKFKEKTVPVLRLAR